MYAVATSDFNKLTRLSKKKDSNPFFSFLAPSITSIMRSEQVKSSRPSRDGPKKRSGTSAPISLEDLMEKEVQSSTQDGAIHELSVLADPSNEQSNKIKRKIRILDHPKNLIEVLRARFAIEKGLAGNTITTGTNQYRSPGPSLTGKHCTSLT